MFPKQTKENEMQESVPETSAADDWAAALAEQQVQEGAGGAVAAEPAAAPHVFERLSQGSSKDGGNDLDMVLEIPVSLTVELGRTKLPIKELLQLAQGSVVELDGFAGEPMDIVVNGCLIAQGEVVVVNDRFGIRVTDIVTPSERMRKLKR
jgi:flagellar motor switch protein FliN/FliY